MGELLLGLTGLPRDQGKRYSSSGFGTICPLERMFKKALMPPRATTVVLDCCERKGVSL